MKVILQPRCYQERKMISYARLSGHSEIPQTARIVQQGVGTNLGVTYSKLGIHHLGIVAH